mmetsp:Transcript_11273/g.27568  ORF Transcript_11273/g.27568 Transcript_11273/m.27568 type:complete len:1022 (+) Transcript_11273:74-3139(+)
MSRYFATVNMSNSNARLLQTAACTVAVALSPFVVYYYLFRRPQTKYGRLADELDKEIDSLEAPSAKNKTSRRRRAGSAASGPATTNDPDEQNESALKSRNRRTPPPDGPLVRIHLWHGSQTGTAEEYTDTLKNELSASLIALGLPKTGFFSIEVKALEDCENFEQEFDVQHVVHDTLQELPVDAEAELAQGRDRGQMNNLHFLPLHVFLVSTYGEGDPAQSAEDFFDKLKSANDEAELRGYFTGLNCAVVGFGNSTYTFFNGAAKTLVGRLSELGSRMMCKESLLDDATDLDEQWAVASGEVRAAVGKALVAFLENKQNAEIRGDWVIKADGNVGARLVEQQDTALGLGVAAGPANNGTSASSPGGNANAGQNAALTESAWAKIQKSVASGATAGAGGPALSPAEERARLCPLEGKLLTGAIPEPMLTALALKEAPRDIHAGALFDRKKVRVLEKETVSQVVERCAKNGKVYVGGKGRKAKTASKAADQVEEDQHQQVDQDHDQSTESETPTGSSDATSGRKNAEQSRSMAQEKDSAASSTEQELKITRATSQLLLDWPAATLGGEIRGTLAHNIDVLPENEAIDVDTFLEYFGLTEPDRRSVWCWTKLAPRVEEVDEDGRQGGSSALASNSVNPPGATAKLTVPFPSGLSLQQIFGQYLDLRRFPKVSEVRKFLSFAKNKKASQYLHKLLDEKAGDENLAHFRDARLRFADFWRLFLGDNVQMGLGQFLQVCPRMKPRIFTGCSSRVAAPESLGILLSTVYEESHKKLDLKRVKRLAAGESGTKTNGATKALPEQLVKRLAIEYAGQYFGHCSEHLTTFGLLEQLLSVKVAAPTLVFPQNPKIPLVLISAGTGLAPFKGFLDQELALKSKRDILLFFGCRSRDEDFLYKKYFAELAPEYDHESNKAYQHHHQDQQQKQQSQHDARADARKRRQALPLPNFRLVCAFSRMGKKKVYVQDKMKLHAEDLKELLGTEQRGQVLVCGSTHMGQGAREVLTMVLGRHAFQALQDEKRYQEEVWAV